MEHRYKITFYFLSGTTCDIKTSEENAMQSCKNIIKNIGRKNYCQVINGGEEDEEKMIINLEYLERAYKQRI